MGLTFEGKAFYDILTHPYNKHNFEYGEDKEYRRCDNPLTSVRLFPGKIKELIDVQSSFAD